ncbi:hypothetical protein DM02DRAFT_153666 [Periconia macrospinosa]|uniref:Zn(2)-C6 fungal-type domain-containing protein n=1 Tax=Periconia macrospinosa TaxID=97972 RepID=A0A2V1EFQ0_9PLEO|nr:hypothetical protein DM02DRAFT_153666 [Periconia macrospinosa]
MQSLSAPASISKRKQACKSCRQRKKRCDGERPTCALCKKWGLRCEYSVPAAAVSDLDNFQPELIGTLFGKQPFISPDLASYLALDTVQMPNPGFEVPTAYDIPTIGPLNNEPYSLENTTADLDLLADVALPSCDVLLDMVDMFFSNYYSRLSCFHKATFYSELHSGKLNNEAPMLLYIICSMVAHLHPDPSIKSQQDIWYNQAKFLYELTPRDPAPALRTIQTALCLIMHGFTRADYSTCWLLVGKAWRQAASLGMNRLDTVRATNVVKDQVEISEENAILSWRQWRGKTAPEREECRRTLWFLYILDRNMSWPSGWPSAMSEQQFKLDIPTTDATFQSFTEDTELSSTRNVPFVRNLNSLIASTSTAKSPLNALHYLVVAHVLLGRIAEHVHSLYDSPDTPEYAQECDTLDDSLTKLRLSLPRTMSSVLEASANDRHHVLWLNVLLNSMAILLHYRESCYSRPDASQDHFIRAIAAAKNIVLIGKDTTRISTSLLYSAHVLCSLYFAGCVLVIQWRTANDESCKDDVEIVKLILDKAADETNNLGRKYRDALKRDLERSQSEILRLRDAGYQGLLVDCSQWAWPSK